jgi:hypothetical protein
MIRPAFCLSAALLIVTSAVRAESPAPAAPSPPSQLDRIEHKLDDVLRQLDQTHAAPAGAAIPSPLPTTASSAPPAAYKPGALVVAHTAPHDVNSLPDIPPDSVGGFVYDGGTIPFTDIRTRGVRYAGPIGAEIQGWLRAKEAGRYEIGTDLAVRFAPGAMIAPTCFFQAWLEGQSLDQRSALVNHPGSQEADASLVLGAELQPGLYRLRVWTDCTTPQGVTTTSELLLKAPSELNLRPVTGNDLLHREG